MMRIIPEKEVEFEREFTNELNRFIFQFLSKKISYKDNPSLIVFLNDSIIIKNATDNIVRKSFELLSYLMPKPAKEKKDEEEMAQIIEIDTNLRKEKSVKQK